MDSQFWTPEELATIAEDKARRIRENASRIARTPGVQRAVAAGLELRLRDSYDEVYLLPTVGNHGVDGRQLSVSAYRKDSSGSITHTAQVWIEPDGRATEYHYRIKDLGPDGLDGRRTKELMVPGKCLCHCAPR